MKHPIISLIAAIGQNRELGKNNKLLWDIKADMHHFKELTSGHIVIMGRKTYESIGKPLLNRTNIVVTHNPQSINRSKSTDGVIVASSLIEALQKAKEVEEEEVFIIGGGQIYKEALPFTDKLYLTLVKGSFEADTFFPDYSMFKTVLQKEDREENGQKFTFIELVK